ncbi:AMP-binding protein [Streptomyces sp. ME19-01-6]|uniref:AMP-binding protein n=1 Tax=Streptomyces sp. ME19-01-6 TaxID=3028686 RepID=UPI0029A790DC|nr:AMP-binding protein [Streptomyces sp. ME19-01-6]MDX3229766.1 AMP-binding protein [Streptomyces sp. ME19-01-6]
MGEAGGRARAVGGTERLDGLPAEAARAHPARTALVWGGAAPDGGAAALDFAGLDLRVSRAAYAIRRLLPGRGRASVAVASVLHPDFAVAYYAAARSGNVVAVVNPLLREEALLHTLSVSEARLAFVDAGLYARLAPVRERLRALREVVLIGPVAPRAHPDVPRLDDVLGNMKNRTLVGPPGAVGPDDVVCVQFTSGTTGLPKAVRLTHRNLVVNAAQIAEAHRVGHGSIALNHLPTYHPMHLNSAVFAGATQVLCAAPDPIDAVEAANRHSATHFYSLPVRLARLAADPAGSVAGRELTTVRLIASGGSALPVRDATRLAERFGVPVFQGYGLAETSPLTHSDDPGRPVPGSVGRPVAGTECRAVDVERRTVLAPGEVGEVQVRGPQVMKGYLGGPDGTGLEEGGWFSTGDVGRIDGEGRLFLVDRLGDTFKCDNFLVAPTEIEQVLLGHELVREAVVFGLPDAARGALAAALVVLQPGAREPEAIAADVADRLPYYQRLHHIEAVDAIPRNANGKVQRRALRDALIARLQTRTPDHATVRTQEGRTAMSSSDEWDHPTGLFTVINTFTLKDHARADEFERRFLDHVAWMRAQEGFDSHQAVRLVERPGVYVNLGRWRSPEAFQRVRGSEVFQAHAKEFHELVEVDADPSRNVLRTGGDVTEGAPVVVVERLGVEGPSLDAFDDSYREYARLLTARPGFLHADFSRSLTRPGSYTFVTWWAEADAWRAARAEAPAFGTAECAVHLAAQAAAPKAADRVG